jgi:hypothetical protein
MSDYVALLSDLRKRFGLTAEQALDLALWHSEYDAVLDAPMPAELHEAFIEWVETPPHLRGPIVQAHADTNGVPPERKSLPSGGGDVIAFRRRQAAPGGGQAARG